MKNHIRIAKAQRDSDEEERRFSERQELKRSLLAPGEIYVERAFLEEIHESICEILERLPDLNGNELTSEVNEAALKAYSRVRMLIRHGVDQEDDIDTSDSEEAAQ